MRFERVETDGQRAEALGAFLALHGQRWEGRGGSTAFYSAALREFHEAWTRVALGRGWLRFFLMRLDGRPVGAIYGFRYRGTFGFYQTGFDPAYARHGIGQVMIGLSIKSAIEEGADEYDLLHGTERYKSDWARSTRELSRIEAYPPSLRGRVHGRLAALDAAGPARGARRAGRDRAVEVMSADPAPRVRSVVKTALAQALSWSGADALIGSLADTGALVGRDRLSPGGRRLQRRRRASASRRCSSRAGCWRNSSTGSAGDTASSRSTSWAAELEPGWRARRPLAAVTFDDGYRDVYDVALPVLARKGIPAAVFVVTDLVGTGRAQVHDRLYMLLCRAIARWPRSRDARSRDLLPDVDLSLPGLDPDELAGDPRLAVATLLRSLSRREVDRLAAAIEDAVGADGSTAARDRAAHVGDAREHGPGGRDRRLPHAHPRLADAGVAHRRARRGARLPRGDRARGWASPSSTSPTRTAASTRPRWRRWRRPAIASPTPPAPIATRATRC